MLSDCLPRVLYDQYGKTVCSTGWHVSPRNGVPPSAAPYASLRLNLSLAVAVQWQLGDPLLSLSLENHPCAEVAAEKGVEVYISLVSGPSWRTVSTPVTQSYVIYFVDGRGFSAFTRAPETNWAGSLPAVQVPLQVKEKGVDIFPPGLAFEYELGISKGNVSTFQLPPSMPSQCVVVAEVHGISHCIQVKPASRWFVHCADAARGPRAEVGPDDSLVFGAASGRDVRSCLPRGTRVYLCCSFAGGRSGSGQLKLGGLSSLFRRSPSNPFWYERDYYTEFACGMAHPDAGRYGEERVSLLDEGKSDDEIYEAFPGSRLDGLGACSNSFLIQIPGNLHEAVNDGLTTGCLSGWPNFSPDSDYSALWYAWGPGKVDSYLQLRWDCSSENPIVAEADGSPFQPPAVLGIRAACQE